MTGIWVYSLSLYGLYWYAHTISDISENWYYPSTSHTLLVDIILSCCHIISSTLHSNSYLPEYWLSFVSLLSDLPTALDSTKFHTLDSCCSVDLHQCNTFTILYAMNPINTQFHIYIILLKTGRGIIRIKYMSSDPQIIF